MPPRPGYARQPLVMGVKGRSGEAIRIQVRRGSLSPPRNSHLPHRVPPVSRQCGRRLRHPTRPHPEPDTPSQGALTPDTQHARRHAEQFSPQSCSSGSAIYTSNATHARAAILVPPFSSDTQHIILVPPRPKAQEHKQEPFSVWTHASNKTVDALPLETI